MVMPDRLLMGPGPSNPYPEVTAAFARPLLGHLDPEFLRILDETCDRLRTVFGTSNALTLPISGTGSAGMEACFVNLVEPGDTVIVGVNGVFGERMCEVARRAGAEVVRVDADWGTTIDPQRLLDAHAEHPEARALAVVHAETSTGVENDVAPLRALADTDTLLLVDTVTSLGGIPLHVDEWGIDACYSGTQKCLGVPPGLSPVTFSARAVERIGSRRTPVQSWYLDLGLIGDYVGTARKYHHTAPTGMIVALHAGLGVVLDEGLDAVWQRHQDVGRTLQASLPAFGFSLIAPEGARLPQLTSTRVPDGVDEAALRRQLLADYDIEVGGGLGAFAGVAWRIGLMGHTAHRARWRRCSARWPRRSESGGLGCGLQGRERVLHRAPVVIVALGHAARELAGELRQAAAIVGPGLDDPTAGIGRFDPIVPACDLEAHRGDAEGELAARLARGDLAVGLPGLLPVGVGAGESRADRGTGGIALPDRAGGLRGPFAHAGHVADERPDELGWGGDVGLHGDGVHGTEM